jgi:hypothetical protein
MGYDGRGNALTCAAQQNGPPKAEVDRNTKIARERGAFYAFPNLYMPVLDAVKAHCDQYQIETKLIDYLEYEPNVSAKSVRFALPIDEYLALRLGQYTGVEIDVQSYRETIRKKTQHSPDPYSVIEHALDFAKTNWLHDRLLSPETYSKVGLFLSQWHRFEKAWVASNFGTIVPPNPTAPVSEAAA